MIERKEKKKTTMNWIVRLSSAAKNQMQSIALMINFILANKCPSVKEKFVDSSGNPIDQKLHIQIWISDIK